MGIVKSFHLLGTGAGRGNIFAATQPLLTGNPLPTQISMPTPGPVPPLRVVSSTGTEPPAALVATPSTADNSGGPSFGGSGGGFGGSSGTPETVKILGMGDIYSRWGAPQRILAHEFGDTPGNVLAVGNLINPPLLNSLHRIHFVHGNFDRVETLERIRALGMRKFLSWEEALYRICYICDISSDGVEEIANLKRDEGRDYSDLKPGTHRIPLADIIPTQEVVLTDTIAQYILRKPEQLGKPSVRIIDGKVYVSIGHHRLMRLLITGDLEPEVEVEGAPPEEMKFGLTPVLHTRHPNIKSWKDVIWKSGVKTGTPYKSEWQSYNAIMAGEVVQVGGLRIAGIPGAYSKEYYDNPDEAPPCYFTKAHVEAMLGLKDGVDVLLMHQAPAGAGFRKNGFDPGNHFLTGLIDYLHPRLVLFGHHHVPFRGIFQEAEIVGLDYPHRSYAVIEHTPSTGKISVGIREAKIDEARPHLGYRYDWQK
ncbi:MAG: hypothetical protein HN337_09585 [Deltaproteobacteria bacterium]|jgi:hypothetical protein|nr:hypothetical protein [Deltaproteobacteria bacterium]